MEISIKVRNVLCALVRLSREGYTMKEYMFYQTDSLSGMYEKMVDGLQFPQTSHLQHVKDDFRDYITGVYKEVDKTSDLSKLYDLVCECWKDAEKLDILYEQFFLIPEPLTGFFVFDHPKGETLSHPEERTLDGLIAHAAKSDKVHTVKGVVDLMMGYLTHSHNQETHLKMIGILDPAALMKFPMTSSDRQVRKVVTRAVEEYFIAEETNDVSQEQEVETQEREIVITEDVVDFIIGQINLKPGFEPDPKLEQYLGDEQRMLELIQTHAEPKIWGKFFNPYDVLETLRNRYLADTDRDEYIAAQINQPDGRKEIRMGLFLLHDEDRVLNVITEHKSVMVWGSATPEEILNHFKTKYGMKIDKKEEDMNAQRINLHGLTIEEAMAAIQKAVPELADRLFIKELPVSETAVNELYQQVVRLEEESVNKVIPQDTKRLMENVYAIMNKIPYTDLLKELAGRLSNPNIHPKAAQRLGYITGLISAAHHTLVNKESSAEETKAKDVATCHGLIKSIMKPDPTAKDAKVSVNNLITKYGPRIVYQGLTGMSNYSGTDEELIEHINKVVEGMCFYTGGTDKPIAQVAQKLIEAYANYCCEDHFSEDLREINKEYGADVMRTAITTYQIGPFTQATIGPEIYINNWGRNVIAEKRNVMSGRQFVGNPIPQGGSFNRSGQTAATWNGVKPVMRVYGSLEEMFKDMSKHSHPNQSQGTSTRGCCKLGCSCML